MAMINAKERTQVILFVEQYSPGIVGEGNGHLEI